MFFCIIIGVKELAKTDIKSRFKIILLSIILLTYGLASGNLAFADSTESSNEYSTDDLNNLVETEQSEAERLDKIFSEILEPIENLPTTNLEILAGNTFFFRLAKDKLLEMENEALRNLQNNNPIFEKNIDDLSLKQQREMKFAKFELLKEKYQQAKQQYFKKLGKFNHEVGKLLYNSEELTSEKKILSYFLFTFTYKFLNSAAKNDLLWEQKWLSYAHIQQSDLQDELDETKREIVRETVKNEKSETKIQLLKQLRDDYKKLVDDKANQITTVGDYLLEIESLRTYSIYKTKQIENPIKEKNNNKLENQIKENHILLTKLENQDKKNLEKFEKIVREKLEKQQEPKKVIQDKKDSDKKKSKKKLQTNAKDTGSQKEKPKDTGSQKEKPKDNNEKNPNGNKKK